MFRVGERTPRGEPAPGFEQDAAREADRPAVGVRGPLVPEPVGQSCLLQTIIELDEVLGGHTRPDRGQRGVPVVARAGLAVRDGRPDRPDQHRRQFARRWLTDVVADRPVPDRVEVRPRGRARAGVGGEGVKHCFRDVGDATTARALSDAATASASPSSSAVANPVEMAEVPRSNPISSAAVAPVHSSAPARKSPVAISDGAL